MESNDISGAGDDANVPVLHGSEPDDASDERSLPDRPTMSVSTKVVLATAVPCGLVLLYGVVAALRFGSGPAVQVAAVCALALVAVLVAATIASRRFVTRRIGALTDRLRSIDLARPDLLTDLEPAPGRTADEIHTLAGALDISLGEWSSERDILRRMNRCLTDDLQEARSRLAHATRKADEAEVTKKEFLSTLNHEIRTPMNGIMGMCELLHDATSEEEREEYVRSIQRCSEGLMSILTDVLDFTRLVAGDLTVEPIPCDLASSIQELVDEFAKLAREKGVEVRLSYDPNAPRHLLVDAARVRQLVSLLLSNAVKFTDHGSITVSITAMRVTNDDARMAITVEDTGIGIPRDQLRSIFDSFKQLDSSLSRRHGGAGLGLAVCRKLAGLLGGEIEVESRPGEGSRFTFTATFAASPAPIRDALVFDDLADAHVLFVDDDPINRQVTQKRFEGWGIRAKILEDPMLVISELRAADADGDPIDVCLLDHQMPQTSGEDLAHAIRAEHDLREIPLILLTSKSARGDARRIRAAGFSGYLVKPLPGETLKNAIAAVLGARRSRTEIFVTRHALAEHRTATGEGSRIGALRFTGRVLVAEDNPINQILARRLLEKMGIEVDVAPNGEVAVERTQKIAYDMVLMDCQMPVMDGVEATERIRAIESGSSTHVPIVAMTANALQQEKHRCLSAGMDDFITKPIDVAMLRDVLARYLIVDDRDDGAEAAEAA